MANSPCARCNKPVDTPGAALCNECWELETRIEKHPEIAHEILRDVLLRKKYINALRRKGETK